MRRWFGRAIAVALVLRVAIAGAWPARVQTPPRLADAVIPTSAAIPLSVPSNAIAIHQTIERVLASVSVPYGLEGPALATVPIFDFARPPVEVARFAGMRLGEALDAIAHVDPAVRWIERDGFILVREGPANSPFLDRQMPPFTFMGTDALDALDAVVTAIDPARHGHVLAAPSAASASSDASITITAAAGTVLDALNALARSVHGSWAVLYDDGSADVQAASVSLRTPRGSYVSRSPVAERARATPDPNLVHVTVFPDLGQAIASFVKAAHVPVGLELLGLPQGVMPDRPGIALDLDRTRPADAIARLVAYDSRYQSLDHGGVVRVWPTAGSSASPWLDTAVDRFDATREPIGSVLDRIIWLSGLPPTGSANVTPDVPVTSPDASQRRHDIPLMPVSVAFDRHGSLRDVLDDLCRSQGLWWQVLPFPPGGSGELRLTSFDGWSISRGLTWPVSGVRPTRPPARVLPPARDYDIDQVTVPLGTGLSDPFAALLSQVGRLPMGLELAPAAFAPADVRVMPARPPTIIVGPGKLSDALYVILERRANYEMTIPDGVINIAPSDLMRSPTHFLNVPLDHFEATGMPIMDAVRSLRRRLNPAYPQRDSSVVSSFPGPPIAGVQTRMQMSDAIFNRPISIAVDHASPREILNRLVLANGDVRWTVRYDGPLPSDLPDPIEANCVVLISTFSHVGTSRELHPVRPPRAPGAMAASSASSASVPPLRAALPVVLPTSASALRTALDAMVMRLRIPVGAVVIEPPETRGQLQELAAERAAAPRYNLAGLSLADTFDKVLSSLPDYAWSLDQGVYHVEPRALKAAADSALNRRVDHVDAQVGTVNDAAALVMGLIDRRPAQTRMPSGPNPPDAVRSVMNRTLRIVVERGRVRDVLDQIALQHGALSWTVVLSDPTGSTGMFQIVFRGFDGWGLSMATAIR
jgi:hypothetical protein